MSSSWTAIEEDLYDDPRTIEMSTSLGIDVYSVVGRLGRVWCRAYKHARPVDTQSVDGFIQSYTANTIDRLVDFDGFALAMEAVGWLVINDDGLLVPRFFTKNGSAKNRKRLDARRKQAERDADNCPQASPHRLRTTEQNKTEPDPSGSGSGSGAAAPVSSPLQGDGQSSRSLFDELSADMLADESRMIGWVKQQRSDPLRLYPKPELDGDGRKGEEASMRRLFRNLAQTQISAKKNPVNYFRALHAKRATGVSDEAKRLGDERFEAFKTQQRERQEQQS